MEQTIYKEKQFLVMLVLVVFVALVGVFPHRAQAAISFVSSTCEASDDGLGTFTLTLPTTQTGDLIIVAVGIADNDNVNEDVGPNLVGTYGYTEVADVFANDTSDVNLGVFWKVMGATPDTSYSVDSLGGNDASNTAVCMVFRGVDTTTPMDVTPVSGATTNTMDPNPGPIDHNNPSGVWTVIAGASAFSGSAAGADTYTFPTGYTTNAIDRSHNDTTDGTVGLGYRSSGVSDPEDPGSMLNSFADGTAFAAASTTIALRPAVLTVATDAETNVTAVSATLNGSISTDGGSAVTARGFAWGTSSTLQSAFGTSTNGTGTGSFSDNVSGLIAGTTYYYRAYATNSDGTRYGTIEPLTAGTDTVATRMMRLFEGFRIKLASGRMILYSNFLDIFAVTTGGDTWCQGTTSGTVAGTITGTGGENATNRGFAWGTDSTLQGAATTTDPGSWGAGIFFGTLSPLTGGQTYFYRAYATNSSGTVYGTIEVMVEDVGC